MSKRKSFGAKAIGFPLPVYIIGTYDENGNADAMNVAWGGQCGSKHFAINISSHKTTENLKAKKAFTLSFATKKELIASDFVGIVSANKDPDKIKKTGWTVKKGESVDAPYFDELPLTLECKVVEMEKTSIGEIRVVGEVVNAHADESILDANGNIDADKAGFISFDSAINTYRVLGENAGKAFSDGAKLK